MPPQRITISALKINLHTNILGKELIVLTSNMLYQPSTETNNMSKFLNTHPYFTFDVKYSSSILYNMTYEERKQFFFNRDKFLAVLKDTVILNKTNNDDSGYDSDDEVEVDDFKFDTFDPKIKEKEIIDEYLKEYNKDSYTADESNKLITQIKKITTDRREISDHNIKLMLEVLFPTTYPSVNNVSDSFSEFIKQDALINQKINIKGALPFLISGVVPGIQIPFSYIKPDLEIYTIVKSMWLNDILNNPNYRKLVIEFIKFKQHMGEEA